MLAATGTIVAVATPAGRGGIGIVRISGPSVAAIATAMCGKLPAPRHARRVTFRAAQGRTLDHGLALYFPAPHSFTGEDVLELQAHGSQVVLDRLVREACRLGARPARAGEFSERAFLNGKLDLSQAEAVADLIAAGSAAQADAALRSLEGEFSRRVYRLDQAVTRLRVEIEAAIDFSDDASEGAAPDTLAVLFAATHAQYIELLAATREGVRITDGLKAVIVGAPNVGKSSLLNALAGNERAIVTDIPGTTRDVLRETIVLDGIELVLADTAGLREPGDAIEGEGIRRARAELEHADLVLQVGDAGVRAGTAADPVLPARGVCLRIINKIDLIGAAPRREEHAGCVTIALSARTGAGLDLLRAELRRIATGTAGGGTFSARTRHVLALERAGDALTAAQAALGATTPELVAEELRAVHHALGGITGQTTSEDLLGAIFSTFCVGK